MNAQSQILAGDGDDSFRASHVGASEVAALFDASPWLTHFELFHRKAGTIATPDFGGNERIEWGIRLEPAIIEAARDRYGYVDREQLPHLSNGKGLGGHPDRRVICPERGPGILEVKCVDWLERKKWGDEPPLHHLLQSQTYQGLDGAGWGDMIVLVGGNALERFSYDFRPVLYAEIERRVETFWQSVRANDPPKPDFGRDRGVIESLFDDPADVIADLRHDNHIHALAVDFLANKAMEKEAAQRAEEARAEIELKLGNASGALLEGMRVSWPLVAGTPPKKITAEMVGTEIGGRKPFRRFSIKETK